MDARLETTSGTHEAKLHPFEEAGMGRGPYRYVGFAEIPSTSLDEANPTAYNNALAALPKGLVGGCGTCQCCGMAIKYVSIVADADGNRYGVGCDCVQKTGDAALGNRAAIDKARAVKNARRVAQEAARAKRHEEWLEKNKERLQWEAGAL